MRFFCFSSFAPCVGVAQLVLGFLSEEIIYVAIDSLCLWEKNSGTSYIAILNQNPSHDIFQYLVIRNNFKTSQPMFLIYWMTQTLFSEGFFILMILPAVIH